MMKHSLCLFCFVLLVAGIVCLQSTQVCATGEMILDSRGWNFYPLEFGHLVVTGEVEEIRADQIPRGDLFMDPPEVPERLRSTPINVQRVRLRVFEVLRGDLGGRTELTLVVPSFNDSRYAVGDTVALGLCYHPVLHEYYLQSRFGKYVRRDSAWLCSVPPGERKLSDPELRAMVAATDIEHVTRDAELILVGRVRASRETKESFEGEVAVVRRVSFDVLRILKGEAIGDTVSVAMIRAGSYVPAWRKTVPGEFKPGETWYLYLKRGEIGWYPFAGSNGMLLLQDNHLVYDERGFRIEYWRSKAEVDRLAGAGARK